MHALQVECFLDPTPTAKLIRIIQPLQLSNFNSHNIFVHYFNTYVRLCNSILPRTTSTPTICSTTPSCQEPLQHSWSARNHFPTSTSTHIRSSLTTSTPTFNFATPSCHELLQHLRSAPQLHPATNRSDTYNLLKLLNVQVIRPISATSTPIYITLSPYCTNHGPEEARQANQGAQEPINFVICRNIPQACSP